MGGLAASKTAEHQDFKVLKSLFLDNKCLFYVNEKKNKPLNLGFLLILGHVADARERYGLGGLNPSKTAVHQEFKVFKIVVFM